MKYRTRKHWSTIEFQDPHNDPDDIYIANANPGQHFHMDFGFVRGSTCTKKQEDGPTITSKNGYNSYILIVDQATRYMWVFLTSNKQPSTELARKVLRKFASTDRQRTVRTDQGQELG